MPHATVLMARVSPQVMEVIGAYRDAGLPPVPFAAAVPKNWQKTLAGLLEELFEDDAAAVCILHYLASCMPHYCACLGGQHDVPGDHVLLRLQGSGSILACSTCIGTHVFMIV